MQILNKIVFKIKAISKNVRRWAHKKFIRALYSVPCEKKGSVLIWHSSGMTTLTNLNSALAFALKLRGYDPHFILCDATCGGACILPDDIDEMRNQPQLWVNNCTKCINEHVRIMNHYKFSYSFISSHIQGKNWNQVTEIVEKSKNFALNEQKKEILNMHYNDIPIGRYITDSLIRHFRNANYQNCDYSMVASYAKIATIASIASLSIIKKSNFTYTFIPHASYAASGPAARAAILRQAEFFSYNSHHTTGYAYRTFHPSDKMRSSCSLTDCNWEKLRNIDISEHIENEINNFFKQRYDKYVHEKDLCINNAIQVDKDGLLTQLGLSDQKPIYGIFTHITWDAAFYFGNPPFRDFDHWLDFSIRTIWNCTNVQWLIKIHPSEFSQKSYYSTDDGAAAYIKKQFPSLPSHIKVIPSDINISPYSFMKLLDGVVSCCGTSGLEAAVHGKKVINACHGYYANRGFTYDAETQDEYKNLLKSIDTLPNLTLEQVKLAKIFFYTYFFERGIPHKHVYTENLEPRSLLALYKHLPNKDASIDAICEGIINKTDVILTKKTQ